MSNRYLILRLRAKVLYKLRTQAPINHVSFSVNGGREVL